jgi:hypothetical protein
MTIQRATSRALLGLLLILPGAVAQAGDAMTIYSELTFVDVAPGEAAAFERGVAERVKPFQQQRIDEDGLFAWALYTVEYADAPHDYVMIRQAIDLAALAGPRLPDGDLADWRATFEVTERTLFDLSQFHTNLEQPDRPWLTLHKVRTHPGHAADFEAVMNEQWEAALREWVATGDDLAAFSRYRVIQPDPAGAAYDQVLVMQHPDFVSLRPVDGFASALGRARPDADPAAARTAFEEAAETVATETWRLVDLATRRPSGD